ncbi:MAG: LytR/AlgR family response regulator transcription factor [Flavobacterium sp.]
MNTKIKCLLLDDELPGLTFLKMISEQIAHLEVVKAYNNPQLLLDEWQDIDFDLLITDIEMPGTNGLQVAEALRGKAIIFTTAYKDFALDAFEKNAVDYLVKPVKPERLQQAVEKAGKFLSGQKRVKPKQIQLNTDKGKALLDPDKMFCIATSDIDSRDKIIIMKDGSRIIVKNASFEKLLEMLPKDDFIRINKKTAVALRNVAYYTHEEIRADVMQPDGSPYTFPLSEIYRSAFSERIKK